MLNSWSIRVKCNGNNNRECGAILEVEGTDLIISLGERKVLYSFVCPCCSSISNIREDLIPLGLKKEILLLKRYELVKGVI